MCTEYTHKNELSAHFDILLNMYPNLKTMHVMYFFIPKYMQSASLVSREFQFFIHHTQNDFSKQEHKIFFFFYLLFCLFALFKKVT